MPRQHRLVFSFTQLGQGKVVKNVHESDLLGKDTQPRPVLVPSAQNLRLYESFAEVRPGYKVIGQTPAPATTAVTGMYQAIYNNNTSRTLRADNTEIREFDDATPGSWDDITGVVAGNDAIGGAASDLWTLAMVPSGGSSPAVNKCAMCNGVDRVRFVPDTGNSETTAGGATNVYDQLDAAKVIVGFNSRAFYMNYNDGARRAQGVWWSVIGEAEDLTNVGSGFAFLADDPYPIANALVMNERLVIYKGNNLGGSIVVGTPTGRLASPLRFDHLELSGAAGVSVGLLLPRCLVRLSAGATFFPAHDGFYLHDGAMGIRRVFSEVSDHILQRVNYNALYAGVAWYQNRKREVIMGFPTGASTIANEFWAFNLPEQRAYGPWLYQAIPGAAPYTAAPLTRTGDLDWDDYADDPGERWEDLGDVRWDTSSGTLGEASNIFGTSVGTTYEDDDRQLTDAGVAVGGTWTSPVMRPDGQQAAVDFDQSGRPVGRTFRTGDTLTLQDVVLRFLDTSAWAPTVQVTTDGQSWTTISDGSTVAGRGGSRVLSKRYTMQINGTDFQVRVSGNPPMKLHGVTCEFTYSGAEYI